MKLLITILTALFIQQTPAPGGAPGSSPHGLPASLFYLFAYTFMVLGTFAVVSVVGGPGDANHSLDAYRGLARAVTTGRDPPSPRNPAQRPPSGARARSSWCRR